MDNIKTTFLKDTKLPIDTIREPYFGYFVNLYEDWLGSKTKWDMLCQEVEQFGDPEVYYQHKKKVQNLIKQHVEESEAFKKLNTMEIDTLYPTITHGIPAINIFESRFVSRDLLSIDMISANWQMWNLLGLTDNGDYKDFVREFDGTESMCASKTLRQAMFGEMNPKRIQKMEKHFTNKVALALKNLGHTIHTCSADEMVMDMADADAVRKVLTETTPNIKWRIEHWKLEELSPERNWITQHNLTEQTVKFRNVPKVYMAQVYKNYVGAPVQEEDLTFMFEGEPAQFKSPLVIKRKPKFSR